MSSISRRAKRMIIHQERNRAGVELNLIPMIDILSVLVSFLLIYATEVEVLQRAKDVELPQSVSQVKPRETVVIAVTGTDILVQGRVVASVAEVDQSSSLLIPGLHAALMAEHSGPVVEDTPEEETEVTIMGDKEIPYHLLKKVMATCTAADYRTLALAVTQAAGALPGANPGLVPGVTPINEG